MAHETIHQTTHISHNSVPPKPMPVLPVETWLQILENTQNVEWLWKSVRLVSKQYKAFVERVVVSHFLPQASVSLSLPRRDPTSGALLYRGQIPGAELSMHYAELSGEKSRVLFRTSSNIENRGLNGEDYLSKRRLDEASSWLWFGSNRGKGTSITISKDVEWDERQKRWVWEVEWRKLIGAYARAKNTRTLPIRTGQAGKAAKR